MKPIVVIAARCTWLFNLTDMNPKGLKLFPFLTEALTDKYDFDAQPDDATTERTKSSEPGIKFKNGQFESPEGTVRVSLELFDDGIVAESPVSTEVTELFMQDAINWATTSFGLVFDPALVKNRIYISEIVVQFTSRLPESLKPLRLFAELLSGTPFGNSAPQPYYPSEITFATAAGATPFSIQKRANSPIEANVFYSRAAVDTPTHLRLLDEFDRMLGEPRKTIR
jgi:hypothetical protein